MNGLEAIEVMKQGKTVIRVSTQILYRLKNGRVEGADHAGSWSDKWLFDLNDTYEEYISPNPLTGWERKTYGDKYYVVDGYTAYQCAERSHIFDGARYDNANYFSTKEKAEEINFKQTLFRKLQRFSDENGSHEIDHRDKTQVKYFILYDTHTNELDLGYAYFTNLFGQVFFVSEETAYKAIEIFGNDLIKYFTHDWSGRNE